MNMEAEENTKPQGARWLRWAWAVLAVVVVLVGAFAATRSSLLAVATIEVHGEDGRVLEAEVLAASGLVYGSPMVDVNAEEIDDRVTALPWVEEVSVERAWPQTVRIDFTERVPMVVAVNPIGERFLLDRTGTVLAATQPGQETLPVIRVDSVGGPGTRVSSITPLLRAAEEVTPDLGAWILALAPTGDGVRAELVGGVIAELGIGTDYRDEMRSLATVLTRVELSCLEVIDVSIHQNPVLLRTQGTC